MSGIVLNLEAGQPPSGQLLDGRYQLIELLKTGDLGQTYLAEDIRRPGHPQCIVKQLRPESNIEIYLPTIRQLFASATATLELLGYHNQIPRLLACFELNREFYLVQEFISGQPLTTELVPGKSWTESQVVQLLQEILDVLEFVHTLDALHGDLKPDNIIRRHSDERLVLIDFDAIKQVRMPLLTTPQQDSQSLTLGFWNYKSPEQLRRHPRPSSDIYALGLIGIQALTGMHPRHLQEDPDTGEIVWQEHVSVNDDLAAVLNRMVRYHFKDRYLSATEALQALQGLALADLPLTPPIVAPLPPSDDISAPTPPTEPDTPLDAPSSLAAPTDSEISQSPPIDSSRLLIGAATGIGAALALTAGSYYLLKYPNPFDQGSSILTQATKNYQAGNFNAAVDLVKSIPPSSSVYQEAQRSLTQWEQDWKIAAAQSSAVEKAFNQGQWSEVLSEASKVPDIAYWQNKVAPTVQQAKLKLEAEADQLIQKAYAQARLKDFTGALNYLKQIPEGTAAYTRIQPKLTEYAQKQQIRTNYLLQKAYEQAAVKDFTGALQSLKEIPQGTPEYDKIQAKLSEYTEKQRIRGDYFLQKAYDRAVIKDFTGALNYLAKIREGTPAYNQAQVKIVEYTRKQRLKAATKKRRSNQSQVFRLEPFTTNDSSSQDTAPGSRSQNVDSLTDGVPTTPASQQGADGEQ